MLNHENFTNSIMNSTKLLYQLSNESASLKKSNDKWTQKEILGHLIDSANVNLNRILSGTEKEDLIFSTYPQNEWVEIQDYNNRGWGELIVLWSALNLHIAKLISQIPKKVLNRTIKNHNFDKICWKEVPENEETSLSYMIKDYIDHLEHHLKQIFNY